MKSTTKVLGLALMGVKEGNSIGKAKEFIADAMEKRVSAIVIEGERERLGLYSLPVSSVLGIGADYIITPSLENASFISDDMKKKLGFFLLGAKVISCEGNVLGCVSEFEFDEKTGEVGEITLDSGAKFAREALVAFSNELVFVTTAEEIFTPAPVEEKKRPASVFDAEQREFLLGKPLTEDVLDQNDAVVFEQGDIITNEMLDKAEEMELMVELTLAAQ